MSDEGDQALLTRTAKSLRDFFGFTGPGDAQTKHNAEWVRQQFEADKQMGPDYLRAAAGTLTSSKTTEPRSLATSSPWSGISPATA